jgi:uncharacterized phage protein (TIGR02220 family)
MAEIRNENYIVIQGWMVNELHLKGNELIVYACIWGFCQKEGQTFAGGLQYLADWTNSSKQGVMNNLKSLIDKGLIVKTETFVNRVKFCSYHTTNLDGVYNKVEQGMQQSCMGGMQKSLTNNKDNINKDINNNIYIIVEYLNSKTGSNYKATTKQTREHINARLNEGFTVDDFREVIDKKVQEWKGTDFEQYLRPATLFGTKFESYLNAKAPTRKQTTPYDYRDEE